MTRTCAFNLVVILFSVVEEIRGTAHVETERFGTFSTRNYFIGSHKLVQCNVFLKQYINTNIWKTFKYIY